jgi:hypothetical protein
MAPQKQIAPVKASHSRTLRVGLIQGGRIIEERLVRSLKNVSIGQSPRNSFVVSSASLPRQYEVFEHRSERTFLKFAAGMDGRVSVGGGVRTLTQIREGGAARRAGDWWVLPMDPTSRGKLVIGDVTLLFQFVPAPPVAPRAQLPATIRGTLAGRMDGMFSTVTGATFVLALIFGIYAEVTPKPKPTMSKKLKQLVQGEMKREHPKPEKPKTPMDVKTDDMGPKEPDAPVVATGPAGKGDKDKDKPKGSGKLAKGTDEYKAKMAELTTFSLNTGEDKMKSIAIAGKCSTPEECRNAIAGEDHLKSGVGVGDLDDRAKSSSAAGGQGVHGSGPSSGSGGQRGLVGGGGKGGKGVGVSGTGTDSGSHAMEPGMAAPPMISGMVTSFVPPPMIEGGAGAQIRAKIRARVYGLRSCYNRALIDNAKLQGSVKISFVIMPNGRLSNVNVESGMGGGIVSCVKGLVGNWALGNIPSQVFYQFSVNFTPGG